MRRGLYSSRVFYATLALTLHLALNVLSDSLHWQEAFGTDQAENDLFVAITFVVGGIATHLAFGVILFLGVISTAHFRLGRYAELAKDFGGATIVMLVSLVVLLATRISRIAMAALKSATRDADTFWSAPPLGTVYSVLWGLNVALSGLFYVKGLSALRRLSASEYQVHPETLRRRDHAARTKARQLYQYHSRNQLMPM